MLKFKYWRNLFSHVYPVLWVRKMSLRTALLSGTVFDVLGFLAKINALSDSMNMEPDMSMLWRLYIHGLLEPRACFITSVLWPGVAVPLSLVCQTHPSHPFLQNVADTECMGRRVKTGQVYYWQFCRAFTQASTVCGSDTRAEGWYVNNGLLWLFLCICPVAFFEIT